LIYAGRLTSARQPVHTSIEPPAGFDFFSYVQQWAPPMCLISNRKEPGSCAYNQAIVTGWTTHGVWPDNFNEPPYPSNCHVADYDFNITKIQPIVTQLLATWPNMVVGDSLSGFWQHEWQKHGTCAESVPAYTGELNYFNQSLTLNKRFDLYNQMSKQGVNASTTATYTLATITTAAQVVTGGKRVKVECVTDQSVWYLQTMYICIDKTSALIDCPASDQRPPSVRTNHLPSPVACPTDQPIYYLPLAT